MATLDQLEVVHPDGSVGFYDLEPAKGTTNIGSDPENDIVIDSPEVPLFLAMIDHRVKPYQIMILDQDGNIELDGQPLQPNLGYELYGWSTVAINGHSLVLTEHGLQNGAPVETRLAAPAGAAAGTPVAAALPAVAAAAGSVHRLTLPPADQLDEYLRAELLQRENAIECEQTASYPLTLINGGDIVATFEVTIEGLDPAWVAIEPSSVNLNEGERASITIAITPPRVPASRAGTHHFAVIITSPNHTERSTRLGATLNLSPFYDFAISDLSPRQLNTGWRKQARTAVTAMALVNKSNAEAVFRVDGEDDQRACAFEYQQPETGAGRSARQTEVRLHPEATATLSVYVTPMKRRLIGLRKQSYSLTVTSLPLSGQQTPRSVMGQLQAAPLIGPWTILGLMGLLALLIIWIFHPYINYFGLPGPDEEILTSTTLLGGQSVSLKWGTSPFVQLKLLQETNTADGATTTQEVGSVTAPDGTSTFTLYEPARYRLVAGNLLSNLLPFLATQSEWVEVDVQPVPPRIEVFSSMPITIVLGQSANLFYRVVNADKLTVTGSDGLVQSVSPTDTGSLSVVPPGTTKYTLGAVNRYGAAEDQIALVVVTPTPTPVPKPNVLQFDVQPRVITEGQSVNITWEVNGAETVRITGIAGTDKFSSRGKLEQQPPPPGVDYQLIATNGPPGAEATVMVGPYHVTVVKAPPPPVAPKIAVFDVVPKSIVRGNSAQLSWSVTGTTTDIVLTGPGLPDAGLKVAASGTQNVYPTTTAIYILTASNGATNDVKSQTVEVTEPIPAPEVTLRASETAINEGESVFLSWEVIGDSTTRVLSGPSLSRSVEPVDTLEVRPGQTSVYSLTVRYRDSAGGTSEVGRNVIITVDLLPRPSIEYFRAGCLSSTGAVVGNDLCGLDTRNSLTENPITYTIWAGNRVRFIWRTIGAVSPVTVTKYAGRTITCSNVDGQESPQAPFDCDSEGILGVERYTLIARNGAGGEVSRDIIFTPDVRPADQPYGIGIGWNGIVGSPSLSVILNWNYYSSTLSSIAGFRIKRTSNTGVETTIDLRPAADYCAIDQDTGVAACTHTLILTDPPDRTCGQSFQVAALYIGLGGILEASDYTNMASLPSCPSTGQ
ncbi:hypothetical protein TFLX_02983 [Thermoflexales bacterium]|nr:hypothetical protein TFLX_02983 [Thermoflexales bacterium]